MSASNHTQRQEAHTPKMQAISPNDLSQTSKADNSATDFTPSQPQPQRQAPARIHSQVDVAPLQRLPTALLPHRTVSGQPGPIAPMSFTPQPQSQAQPSSQSSNGLRSQLPSQLCLRGGCTDDCCDCCGCYHGSSNLAPRRQGSLVWYGQHR